MSRGWCFVVNYLRMFLLMFIVQLPLIGNNAEAANLDCTPLDPRQEISKEITADIEGAAKILLKLSHVKGEIEGKFSEKVKSLQDKYPNSDQLIIKKHLLYFYCTYLNSAKDLSSGKK